MSAPVWLIERRTDSKLYWLAEFNNSTSGNRHYRWTDKATEAHRFATCGEATAVRDRWYPRESVTEHLFL